MKEAVKKFLFGKELRPMTIKLGLGRGIIMNIDPLHKMQRVYGLDEQEIASAFQRFAKQSTLFLDIGANDGYYSLCYKHLCPNGLVIACEPDNSLQTNFEENVHVSKLFGDKDWRLVPKFIQASNDATGVTIDSLVADTSSELQPVFLKIDIDGGELSALQGARQTLATRLCFLVLETHSVELEEQCSAFLQNLGYQIDIIDNAWWRVVLKENRIIPHNRWFTAQKM